MVTGNDVYYEEFITIVDAAKADVEEQRIRKNQCCHPRTQHSQTRHLIDIAQNYKKVKVQWTKQFVAKPQKNKGKILAFSEELQMFEVRKKFWRSRSRKKF